MCLQACENAFNAVRYRPWRVNIVDPYLPGAQMMSCV
jgi:hypothetical protein